MSVNELRPLNSVPQDDHHSGVGDHEAVAGTGTSLEAEIESFQVLRVVRAPNFLDTPGFSDLRLSTALYLCYGQAFDHSLVLSTCSALLVAFYFLV